ncbi:MAG: hypothetical protein NY202_01980 [Mollicutes bacterium UO1]
MLKKPVKKIPNNQSELKKAYDLVAKDLLVALKKAQDGTQIKLGDCGVFQKKLSRITNPYGEVFRYYRIIFKASRLLKKELDK